MRTRPQWMINEWEGIKSKHMLLLTFPAHISMNFLFKHNKWPVILVCNCCDLGNLRPAHSTPPPPFFLPGVGSAWWNISPAFLLQVSDQTDPPRTLSIPT